MTHKPQTAAAAPELCCANCGRPLDANDRFCRDCGLPTAHLARTQRAVVDATPDLHEMRRALDAQPDPRPFARVEPIAAPLAEPDVTTGDVVRATSPTLAAQMASSTAAMVALIIFLVGVGVSLLYFAVR